MMMTIMIQILMMVMIMMLILLIVVDAFTKRSYTVLKNNTKNEELPSFNKQ